MGVEAGNTTFGGGVPSDLWRFLPLAVLRTCLAEMVLLPTRFFFDSAVSILLSKEAEDTCGADSHANTFVIFHSSGVPAILGVCQHPVAQIEPP